MQQNRFSFQQFYTRRIKRIFPIFILVMGIASIFSSLFFIRSESELQRKGIELGIVFASNFFLAHRQGYWDLAANENPILHIWSLAVEEQYYLFFPVLLFIFYRKAKSQHTLIKLSVTLFLFFALSYLLPKSVYESIGLYNHYYVSNLRFPELLVGSLLALLPLPKLSLRLAQMLSFSALIALILCLIFYHSKMPLLLNSALLLPCFLAALLIYAMEKQTHFVTQLFATKPFVFIGKLSYSLYLFHWLFIAWAHYITGDNTLNINTAIIVLLLTFGCSLISYFIIENPIRHSKLSFKQSLIFIYLIPSLIIVSYNLATKSWVMERTNQYKDLSVQINKSPRPAKIALWGDSHAHHLVGFLDYIGEKEDWNSVRINFPEACIFPLNLDNTIVKGCEQTLKQLENYPIVFISMFYDLKRNNGDLPRITPREFYIAQFDEKLQTLVRYLAKTKQVYVFADNKVINRSPLRAIFLQKYGLDRFLNPIAELGNKAESNAYIYQLIKDIPNVKWVDAAKYLPDTYFMESLPLYEDQDHLSIWGALKMAEAFHQNERLLREKDVKNLYVE